MNLTDLLNPGNAGMQIPTIAIGEVTHSAEATPAVTDRVNGNAHTFDFVLKDGSGLSPEFISVATVAISKHWYLCTANLALTLPAGSTGADIRVSTIGDADTVTITPNGTETISGNSGFSIKNQNSFVEFVWNGTQWEIAERFDNPSGYLVKTGYVSAEESGTVVDNIFPAFYATEEPTSGKTYYFSSENGNDDNDGLTWATAWKTGTKLVSLVDGITSETNIYFEEGNYSTGLSSASNIGSANFSLRFYGGFTEDHLWSSRQPFEHKTYFCNNGLMSNWKGPSGITDGIILDGIYFRGATALSPYYCPVFNIRNCCFNTNDEPVVSYQYMLDFESAGQSVTIRNNLFVNNLKQRLGTIDNSSGSIKFLNNVLIGGDYGGTRICHGVVRGNLWLNINYSNQVIRCDASIFDHNYFINCANTTSDGYILDGCNGGAKVTNCLFVNCNGRTISSADSFDHNTLISCYGYSSGLFTIPGTGNIAINCSSLGNIGESQAAAQIDLVTADPGYPKLTEYGVGYQVISDAEAITAFGTGKFGNYKL